MKNDNLFESALDNWRSFGGKGTTIIPSIFNDKDFLLCLLCKIYNHNSTRHIVIITKTFNERQNIIEYITNQEQEKNNEEFKTLMANKILQIFTENIITQYKINRYPHTCILYHPDSFDDEISDYVSKSRFKLVMLNKVLDGETMSKLYKVAPLLNAFKQNELDSIRTQLPVEEECIGVTIDDVEDSQLLQYYDNYISASMNIFGNLDKMTEANVGNKEANISSATICEDIARENGWNEHLDMSIGYNVQIDEMYNPIQIKERASKTFEIIRTRSAFVGGYKSKLPAILNIIANQDQNTKILIINKDYNFATKVEEYINENLGNICKAYHTHLLPILATDADGNPICYKSGAKKGEKKMMCEKAQRTLISQLFDEGKITVISTTDCPPKELYGTFDLVIYTSPLCAPISELMYRLAELKLGSKIVLKTLYIENSIEQTKLAKILTETKHNIVNLEELQKKFIGV